jgi:Kelch motif
MCWTLDEHNYPSIHSSICRRLWCLGGKDALNQRLDTVEAFDPREGRWQVVGRMPEARSSFGCAVLAGHLYVAGGNDASGDPAASMVCFDPLMEQWQPCAPLPWRSAGLGMCAV